MAQQHPLFNPRESAPGSYRELYMTAGYQKGGPVPARLMASYRFTEALGGGERPTPANLKEQTLALSERRPVAFLCLYRKTGATNVEVRILHRMLRYYELPGDKAGGEAADLSMGLLGEVRAAQIPVVEVDNSLFSLIGGAVRVPTVAVMPELLAAAPPGSYLGPYGADVPGTELVRTRVTQVIPTKYAAALVHRDGVAPATAYQELAGMLEADGTTEACADVLTWLRVACTARGGAGELAAMPAVAQVFTLLLLPDTVSDYVTSKVAAGDLPGGRQPRGQSGPAWDQMVQAVQQLATTTAGGGREQREPKGIAEAYRETFPVLLRYCQVQTVDEVAPIWKRLSTGTKGEQQSIIQ